MKAIDMFAGAGGFTEAARLAGVKVVYAMNHWPEAVQQHEINHPGAQHECEDAALVDYTAVPAHDLLLASPSCTGHTPARGKDMPHHDAARSTAWAVVTALEVHRPAMGLVENVPAFLNWPLYPAWRMAIEALGYAVAPHIVDAADHGVPQNRVRVFIALTRSKAPVMLHLPKRRHIPASTFIDYASGNWTPINRPGRAKPTLERVANGRREFGDRFLMSFNGNTRNGRSIERPIGTITTRDRWGVVDGDVMRMLSVDEGRAAMSFRPCYELPDNKRDAMMMLGNAVAPTCAADVIAALRAA